MRAIPIAGCLPISYTSFLQISIRTYPILRTHVKQPQDLLLKTQSFLMNSRSPSFLLPLLPILLNLCIGDFLCLLLLGTKISLLNSLDFDGCLLCDRSFGG